jgi:LuxR family transcriptional regulator, maltose regulon positive regulatory protein
MAVREAAVAVLGIPAVKTTVPRLPPRYWPRPRLLADLDEATDGQVTLVSAPAGYGKTLLLADWAAQHPERVAWVSLDEDDNNDRRLWSALVSALCSCPVVAETSPLHALAVPGLPSRNPEFLAQVVNALGTAPTPIHLVLDDVHELTAPDAVRGVAMLVRDRPPPVHVVLSGRVDPPLPLGRMRVAGELCEIRADRLRFTVAEASAMLAAAESPVSPEQVRLLVEQTDGWAAGLRLAVLSLREAGDPDRFVADFLGSSRAVSDYLIAEVLSRLPADTRELLGAVSVCDTLCASLASALSGRSDAGMILASLERETSLVLSTGEDRIWYRVHPLLRSHLHAELLRQQPDQLVRLHARAADWFAGTGEVVTALAHARRTGDPSRISAMLRRHATELIAEGEHTAVRESLEQVGSSRIAADPWLALVSALVAAESGALTAADDRLAIAESEWPADPEPGLRALREIVRARRSIVDGEETATPELPTEATAELGLAAMALLNRAVDLLHAGRRGEARDAAESALAQARQQHHGYTAALALVLLSAIAASDGDYRRMTTMAESADRELPALEWQPTIAAAWSSATRAYGALLRAQPESCLELVSNRDATDRPESRTSPQLFALRTALRGAALVDLGRTDEGMKEMREARAAAEPGTTAEIAATIALLEHDAASRLGRGDVARDVMGWSERRLGPVGEVALLHSSHQAGLGRYDAARGTLARVLDGSQPIRLPWTLIECRAQACKLALHAGWRSRGRHELDHALASAEGMGVLRPLVTGPPEVIELLTLHLGSFGESEPTALRVLAARTARGIQALPVALTNQERAVLRMLPTQRSFGEIAGDLTVSHSTVKTHVRSIYGKLGVNSRRDAVVTARQRGILSTVPS